MKKKVGILTTLSLAISKIVYGKQTAVADLYGPPQPLPILYGIPAPDPIEQAPTILDILLKVGKIAIVPIILIIGIVAIVKIKKKKNKKDINENKGEG